MDKIEIIGGNKLSGKIPISGAKNASLAILPAALLTDEDLILTNIPYIKDIENMLSLLSQHGVKHAIEGEYTAQEASKNRSITLNSKNVNNYLAPYDIVRKMRASVLVLGPLLAKFGKAIVSIPGGCAIGNRPIDMHLYGLKQMGAEIYVDKGYVHASTNGKRLKGAEIVFEKVSVGATENILMAASLAEGVTEIHNAAMEPEVADLAKCLQAMGAKIEGGGTSHIIITGVDKLHGATHHVISDRIEAGTYIIAAAITDSDLEITNFDHHLLLDFLKHMREIGLNMELTTNGIRIFSGSHLKPVNIKTQPYPLFPTDLQAQTMALLCTIDGVSHIEETIFENRFMHVPELTRMGANIELVGNIAIINGIKSFRGAEVMATDLRASVSLVLAALSIKTKDKTIINRIYHLERGYEKLVEKLKNCGAEIYVP